MLVLEQHPGLFECALLARRVDVDRDVGGGQDGGEAVHDWRSFCNAQRATADVADWNCDRTLNYRNRPRIRVASRPAAALCVALLLRCRSCPLSRCKKSGQGPL